MKLLTLFFILLASQVSQAGFLLEPSVGYNKGQEQSSTLSGIGLGLKLGYDSHDFFIAGNIDYSDVQQGTISSVKYTNTGIVFGGEIQHLRIWYGIISSTQFSYPSGSATVTEKGTGSLLGIGTNLGGKLNVNFELRSLIFTSLDSGTGTTSAISENATIGFLSISWSLF